MRAPDPTPRQFGNKFELQLATLDFATDLFRREVWKPAEHVPAGMPRLLAICDSARHLRSTRRLPRCRTRACSSPVWA